MPATAMPPPRASIWEWAQTALLVANLGWTTLCLGGYRAETMVVTATLNALLLGLHCGRRALAATPPPLHPAGWLLLPFPAYAAANVGWVTPVAWLGWQDWLVWAQLVAVFWIVLNDLRDRSTRKFLFGSLLALAASSAALACYQRFAAPGWLMLHGTQAEQFLTRSSGPFAVPNSLAALLVLLLPATAWPLWRRGASAVERVAHGYLAALLLLGLGLTVSRGAWLGLAAALVAWPLLARDLGWRRRLGLSVGIVLAVVAIGALLYSFVPQARERLGYLTRDTGEKSRPVLWRAAWLIFREHPVAGAGAGSYAVAFERHRPEHEQKDPLWAHNDYLNTLSDYGAAGFGLFFGACGVIAWRGGRRQREASATGLHRADRIDSPGFTTALVVGLLAFALHLAVDFHLKIPALAMLAATVAGLIVKNAWPPGEISVGAAVVTWSRRAPAGIAAAAILGGAIWWVVPLYRAEAERDGFRRRLDALAATSLSPAERRLLLGEAHEAFSRAIALNPANAQAWADRAYVAAIRGHDEPRQEKELGLAAEADARRALTETAAVAEFWLRLGVALDMQGRWNEAGDAFTEGLKRAPTNAVAWFYSAYHLSLNRVTVPLAQAAVATSLRLDPSRLEAERLRQHLEARR